MPDRTPLPAPTPTATTPPTEEQEAESLKAKLAADPERAAAVMSRIFEASKATGALRAKSNAEIADLVMEHVWSNTELFGAHEVLIGEVIERLRAPAPPSQPEETRDPRLGHSVICFEDHHVNCEHDPKGPRFKPEETRGEGKEEESREQKAGTDAQTGAGTSRTEAAQVGGTTSEAGGRRAQAEETRGSSPASYPAGRSQDPLGPSLPCAPTPSPESDRAPALCPDCKTEHAAPPHSAPGDCPLWYDGCHCACALPSSEREFDHLLDALLELYEAAVLLGQPPGCSLEEARESSRKLVNARAALLAEVRRLRAPEPRGMRGALEAAADLMERVASALHNGGGTGHEEVRLTEGAARARALLAGKGG